MDKSTQLAVTPQHAPVAPGNGTGSALFVINLCASIAPVRLDGNNIPGLENYRLYQVARNEDGRTRHRLRLGFFTSESHAESVLTVVRQQYPTAFTACLCEEDRRFARGYLPEAADLAIAASAAGVNDGGSHVNSSRPSVAPTPAFAAGAGLAAFAAGALAGVSGSQVSSKVSESALAAFFAAGGCCFVAACLAGAGVGACFATGAAAGFGAAGTGWAATGLD